MDAILKSVTLRHHLVILLCAGVIFFTNLGVPKLWDVDEPRNAGCAAEMRQANDWVVPIFNGELRIHKPVLLYWFILSAYELFGVNEFAARFWSAVLGLGTTLMTYHLGRRLFSPAVGLWAAIVLASTLTFGVIARAATPDSVLIFFTTAAMLVYVVATFRKACPQGVVPAVELRHPGHYFPKSWTAAALMYALMGMAVLAKGPIGLVVPTAVIGMFLLIKRLPPLSQLTEARIEAVRDRLALPFRLLIDFTISLRTFGPTHFLRTCAVMRPLTAISMVLLVAGPWYLWVGLRTEGAWLRGFFLTHNLHRAAHAMEGHDGSLAYYPAVMLIFLFPWSVLAVPLVIDSVKQLRARGASRDGVLLAICWVAVWVGLFSLASTKLPNYIAPMYPAVALLFGAFLDRWIGRAVEPDPRWVVAAMAILALVGGGIAVTLPLVASRYVPGEEWLGALGLIPIVGSLIVYHLAGKERRAAAVSAFSAMAVLFATTVFGVAAIAISKHHHSSAMMDTIRAASERPHIAALGCMEPSWVFYAQQPIVQLDAGAGEDRVIESFARRSAEDVFVITTKDRLDEVLDSPLGERVEVVDHRPYFLEGKTLVVLRVGAAAQVADRAGGASHQR